jgi:SAM-dependent methyltransferase
VFIIEYDHGANRHTVDSPRAILPMLFADRLPRSLLDVGCGIGTWARTAMELGIGDVMGIDGVAIAASDLLIPPAHFRVVDLSAPWRLERRFDVALCLEVAEHLDARCSEVLIDGLVSHADQVVFSAACPGQAGQHHVNCQWPDYWQRLFNNRGFVCSDAVRWTLWARSDVESWYRQNMFVARRDESVAGTEPRLPAVVHPDMLEHLVYAEAVAVAQRSLDHLATGAQPMSWYLSLAARALAAKVERRWSGR